MIPAVACVGLVKRYPDVVAVRGVDLVVEPGICLGLLGPNGAGKTTTVEMIEGLTEPSEGHVALFGRRWGESHATDREIRRSLGVQLQETQLQEKLTVEETVRLFRSFFPAGRSVDEAIGAVALDSKRAARVGKLSGGQRQRLTLACALVGAPRLLCLDEPTTGLDPQSRRQVWEVVEAFRAEGGTVLLTTHYMEEATRLADRVAILDHGRIIADGTPDQLIASLGERSGAAPAGVAEPASADATIVELTTDRPIDGLAAVEGVLAVSGTPPHYRLHTTGLERVMVALLAHVRAASAAVVTVATHRATLEDVFVHLTGRGLRDG